MDEVCTGRAALEKNTLARLVSTQPLEPFTLDQWPSYLSLSAGDMSSTTVSGVCQHAKGVWNPNEEFLVALFQWEPSHFEGQFDGYMTADITAEDLHLYA